MSTLADRVLEMRSGAAVAEDKFGIKTPRKPSDFETPRAQKTPPQLTMTLGCTPPAHHTTATPRACTNTSAFMKILSDNCGPDQDAMVINKTHCKNELGSSSLSSSFGRFDALLDPPL